MAGRKGVGDVGLVVSRGEFVTVVGMEGSCCWPGTFFRAFPVRSRFGGGSGRQRQGCGSLLGSLDHNVRGLNGTVTALP